VPFEAFSAWGNENHLLGRRNVVQHEEEKRWRQVGRVLGREGGKALHPRAAEELRGTNTTTAQVRVSRRGADSESISTRRNPAASVAGTLRTGTAAWMMCLPGAGFRTLGLSVSRQLGSVQS
jgi:hypothetical protein